MKTLSPPTFPIVVIEDRYGGAYSRGIWFAVARADVIIEGQSRGAWCLDHGPNGGDIEANIFWHEPPMWVASGASPDAALLALECKIQRPLGMALPNLE
ncbi:hypothetical protein [Pseudorhodoplanes sinuspersici]|uniref:Uncharacterized protein n=1 Tax=Pseudorhodoplanes sinuspersici TaxID=1235591 RepID=A0A1W6ZVN2_9HYPH|nr:hypothetical protein [Pseudorhodoplanes sinuspersici]ARQ01444.1 hypothetical protein CAK95_21800 [Pseudorhodoplanes sinuspersici]RKE73134.1 hypothetical protein DFP91_1014 [Pseudorhodoplanes sinuspersici]